MKIKLDNVSYELEMADKKSKMLGDDNRGICYYELASILINKDIPNDLKIQTFYHELAHAMLQESSFNAMIETELTTPMYEVFIDNLGRLVYNYIHKNDLKKLENYILGESNEDISK
nr:MAG TPA: SprT-like family protein [Caudoviricetes sp.]